MRALNTIRRPIITGGDTVTSGRAAPRINLKRLFARQDANPPDDGARCISGSAHVISASTTGRETVTLQDGTQIIFGTIDLATKLENA